eukprot:329570-Heterocapsa_arctica.AAC.1
MRRSLYVPRSSWLSSPLTRCRFSKRLSHCSWGRFAAGALACARCPDRSTRSAYFCARSSPRRDL